ncbi:MAG: hypothetical protein M0P58_02030 [Bacteroidales bacterium]|nr:hypothetical protein [Bacteroidales bacterium]
MNFMGVLYSQGQGAVNPYLQPKPNAIIVERSINNLPVISDVKSFIDKAMGWTLQDDGKWISQENRLLYSKTEFNNSGKTYYKLGKENFDIIELRDVTSGNDTYVVMIIKYRTGYYEFPILMDGWHNQLGLSFFVFKRDKLNEVIPEKMDFNKVYITNMEVICSGSLVDYNKSTLNSTIAYNIQKTLSEKTIASHNLLIAIWPVQTSGQTLMRFRLIQVMNKKKFYMPYFDPKNRDRLFKSSYFEIDYNVFQNFIHYSGGAVVPQFNGYSQNADEFYKKGVTNYTNGNYSQSIADLTQAARFQPYSDFFLTYAYRANSRQKTGDYTGALQDFDRAVMLKPSDQGYYTAWLTTIYNRGVVKRSLKDINGACQDWHTAIQMGFKDKEMEDAIKESCKNFRFTGSTLNYTTVATSSPGVSSMAIQNDYYKVYWDAVWKYENGNYNEAVLSFNRALELQPQTNPLGIYTYRGNCKLKLTDYTGAIQDFDYVLALSSTLPTDNNTLKTIFYNRGLANFFLGNTTGACNDFQKSINAGMSDQPSLNFIKQVCK